MILNHHTPDDFVVSTMETHSVRGMCDFLCDYLNIDKSCIKQDAKYLRAEELPYLKGDSTKIRNNFRSKPTYNFE
jgi:GDPmannose 4,6-dehydratase